MVTTDGKTMDQVFQEVEKLAEDIIASDKTNDIEVLWPINANDE